MKTFLKEAKGHTMTGLSWAIPMLIGSGMIIAIPSIIGIIFGVTSWNFEDTRDIWHYLYLFRQVGWAGISLLNVVLAGFIAYSIGDKAAIGAGFVAGYFANSRGTGFLGAILLAFIAGYSAKYLLKHLKFGGVLEKIKGIVFIPLLTMGCVAIVATLIDTPLVAFNGWMIDLIRAASAPGVSSVLLAGIIGMMIAADLGGPINKAAFTAVTVLVAEGVFSPAVWMRVAICSIPLGYALAVFIKKDRFTDELQSQGIGSFVMSLVGITEGAIPFVLASPLKLTVINMIGAGIGSAISAFLGAATEIPMFGGVYGFLAVTQKPWAYLIGVAVSALFICFMSLRFIDFKKDAVDEAEEDDDIVITEGVF